MKSFIAEFFGTFWLVLGGCGSAVLAAAFPEVGIGLLGVALILVFLIGAVIASLVYRHIANRIFRSKTQLAGS